MEQEITIPKEFSYLESQTVQDLIDNLSLFRKDKPIMVINQQNGDIRGVYSYELNGGKEVGHSLSIGKSLFKESHTASILLEELERVLYENVYTENGGRFTITPNSKVFFSVVGQNEQNKLVGVTEINGTPIIITE